MKTLVIVGPAHPYRGGIASFNERLAKEFQKQGWNVKLITFTLQYPSFLFPGKDQLHDGPKPKDLDITRMLNSINPLSWSKTARHIKSLKPDLIITHFWHPYLGPAIGKVLKNSIPQNITIIHNLFPHERSFGDTSLIKKFIKNSNRYIALSQKVVKDLSTLSQEENTTYSPHPVYDNYGELVSKEVAKEKLKLSKENKYILFFGLIRKYKGLDLLLDAFANFSPSNKKVKLLVAGEFYDNQEKYIEQVKKLGINDQVIFHDHFIPNDQVKYYFSACDLVAQTYHNATQSGIMQIAIHFKKPMLVTNVGGLKEIIEHNVHGYVTEVNTKEITKALSDYFQDKEKQAAFSHSLDALKEKYSWTNFYQTINSITFKT